MVLNPLFSQWNQLHHTRKDNQSKDSYFIIFLPFYFYFCFCFYFYYLYLSTTTSTSLPLLLPLYLSTTLPLYHYLHLYLYLYLSTTTSLPLPLYHSTTLPLYHYHCTTTSRFLFLYWKCFKRCFQIPVTWCDERDLWIFVEWQSVRPPRQKKIQKENPPKKFKKEVSCAFLSILWQVTLQIYT